LEGPLFGGKSEKHLLVLSFSAFDPTQTLASSRLLPCSLIAAVIGVNVAHSSACERVDQQRELSMILGMSVGAFTILHVIITLIAMGSGLIVVGGMFASHRLPVTTALFLFTTALTSVTGFLFPIHGFTPGLGVGIVACVILVVALFALYKEHLVGAWRWIYVITAVASLYLNVFVLVVQSFVKVSALNALAPTQSEPPFAITQAVVLVIFILIALIAVITFRPGTTVRV
jgi:hypothetical protein